MIGWKTRNNFDFGRRFKFVIEFELKILEAELL
jgi:hypothetical protein